MPELCKFFSSWLSKCTAVLLCLGTAWCSTVRAATSPLDSLQTQLRNSRPDTNQIRILLEMSRYYIYKPLELEADLDSALLYLERAEKLSRQLHYSRGEGESLFLRGRLYLEGKRNTQLRALLRNSKPDTNLVRLLLHLGLEYLYKPGELRSDLDTALHYTQWARNVSQQLHFSAGEGESLVLVGNILVERQDTTKGRMYLQMASAFNQRILNWKGAALACGALGVSYSDAPKDSTAKLQHFRQAASMYHRAGDRRGEADILNKLAWLHYRYGKFGEALAELQAAIQLEKTLARSTIFFTYDLLANVYVQLGNYQESLRSSFQSIRAAVSARDTAYIYMFYDRLGETYFHLRDWNKAVEYYKKSLWHYQRLRNGGQIIHLAGRISLSLIGQRQEAEALRFLKQTLRAYPPDKEDAQREAAYYLGECYNALGLYAEAESNYLRMLDLTEQQDGMIPIKVNAFQRIGTFYLNTRNLPKARTYLGRALKLGEQYGLLHENGDIHLQLFKVDSTQGNLSSAIRHYQQYKAINDSVFSQTKSRQIAGLQLQYDLEKKDQDLKLKEQNIQLLTKHSQLQQQQISKARILRNVVIGSAIALAFLLGLVYNRYRIKQQSNRELEARQKKIEEQNQYLEQLLSEKDDLISQKDFLLIEKEWLLREIHHRVKNNLQIVMSLLNSQAAYLKDDIALSAIQESQHRVHAMALIHQKLYQSEKVAAIAMDHYVREVVEYLNESYNPDNLIAFQLTVESIELDVAQAVPLGLIINEAVTNCLKYAFPDYRRGRVTLHLRRIEKENFLLLSIADNGVGLPSDFDPGRQQSLGMNLMQGLSRQLGGELKIESSNGLTLNILFADEKSLKTYATT